MVASDPPGVVPGDPPRRAGPVRCAALSASLLEPPQYGGRKPAILGAGPVGASAGLCLVWSGSLAVPGTRSTHRLGRRHPSAPPELYHQQHSLSNPALGEGALLGQPSAGAHHPAALRGLDAQVWPPHLSAGNFCRYQPLPRHLLPGCQLAAGGAQTTGRTRQNKSHDPQSPPKAVWLYPLRPDYRQALCAS